MPCFIKFYTDSIALNDAVDAFNGTHGVLTTNSTFIDPSAFVYLNSAGASYTVSINVTDDFWTLLQASGGAGLSPTTVGLLVDLSDQTEAMQLGGGALGDWFIGGAGPDTMSGMGGADTLSGGANADSLLGGADGDQIYGGDGNDTINGEAGDDTLYGGDGTDTIVGGPGNDVIDAGAGNDIIFIESAADLTTAEVVSGGAGSDFIRFKGAADGDTLVLGANVVDPENTITASINNNQGGASSTANVNIDASGATLTGGVRLSGSSGNNVLTGSAYNDTLAGGSGADTLAGGAGADIVSGGAGGDRLTGGDGNDTFTGSASDLNGDTVTDFAAGDSIVVTGLDLSSLNGTDAAGLIDLGGGQSLTLSGVSAANGKLAAVHSDGNTTISFAVAATPTLTGFTDDTGTTGDNRTADATPTIAGSAGVGDTVILYVDGAEAGTVTADVTTGLWTLAAGSLGDGAHTLTARAVDSGNSTSGPSAALTITIDTAVDAPSALDLAAASDSGASDTDNLTTQTSPTFTGSVAEAATVVLYDGASALGTVTAAGAGTWTITPTTLTEGTHTLTARAVDVAGNTSAPAAGLTVTVDITAPTLSASDPAPLSMSATTGQNITLTLSETVVAGTTAPIVSLYRGAAPGVLVETFDLGTGIGSAGGTATISGGTVTLDPHADLDTGTKYFVQVAATALGDPAGNAFAGVTDTTSLAFTTAMPEPSPTSGGDGGTTTVTTPVLGSQVVVTGSTSATSTIDGVAVQQQRLTVQGGAVVEILEIPVVPAARPDADAATPSADIPLARDAATGRATLQASVPTGVGLRVEGNATAQTPADAMSGLIRAIEARTGDRTADKAEMTGVGQGFLGALPQDAPLLVRTIVPTVAPGATAVDAPLRITGSTPAGTTAQEALVIDASGLPSGTVIELDNVSFAAVLGAVRVTGGAGSQTVVGDSGAQYIVLGADDDTLRGGGGADFVGSQEGDDALFGDDGNDTVAGGVGNDTLYGNRQDDLLYGNAGADLVFGGQDGDTVFGGLDGDVVYGQLGADVLYGNKGMDTLFGGQADDTLFGGQGDDVLYGNLGADVLDGNQGMDTLYGGGGADRFVLRSPTEGPDTIADFDTGIDAIAIVGPNFGVVSAGTLSARHFALGAPGDGDDWFVFDTATGVLSFDADGSGAGAAVAIARLDVRTLSASDITVLAG